LKFKKNDANDETQDTQFAKKNECPISALLTVATLGCRWIAGQFVCAFAAISRLNASNMSNGHSDYYLDL
jgi:hypothetical protein